MATIKVSATHARNNFFTLLNQVAAGQEVIIEKDSKEVAVISPKQQKMDWKKFDKASKAAHGILKDDDNFKLENLPTRKPGAWGKFGKW
jgi:prevent-host-death family protein